MNNEYYIWNTESETLSAMSFINNSQYFPIVGNNAKTGRSADEKELTTSWATNTLALTTGEFAIPRITEDYLMLLDIPQSTIDYFISTFNPDIRELTYYDFVHEDIEP